MGDLTHRGHFLGGDINGPQCRVARVKMREHFNIGALPQRIRVAIATTVRGWIVHYILVKLLMKRREHMRDYNFKSVF